MVAAVKAQNNPNQNYNSNSNYSQQGQNNSNFNNQGKSAQTLTPQDKAQKTANHLQKKLGLSPDQASQIYNLTLAHEQAKIDYDNACINVLSPEQQQVWTQLKAEEQAKREANQQQKGNNSSYINTNGNGNNMPTNNNNNLDYNGGNH